MFNCFETYYAHTPYQADKTQFRNRTSSLKLEELILLALADKWQSREYLTTTEIAQLINSYFNLSDRPKSKNNVSRYFNQTYYPYYEIKLIEGRRKYRLSNTGFGRVQLLSRELPVRN